MAAPEDILAGLDDHQRSAALAVRGPVRILAGAGSGKTRTITHRIAYAAASGAQNPERALAVTFTAKAAGEMRARLAGLGLSGVAVSTFHAAALRQLRYFWPMAVGGAAPRLLAAKSPFVAQAAAGLGRSADRALLRDLASEIEWAKVSRVTCDGYAEAAAAARRTAPGGLAPNEVAAAYRMYSDLLAQGGLMDFEDVLLLTSALLQDRPDIADQVRARYRWITVDEYQDLSEVQLALLRVWLGESAEICVVGDPGQTIYSFAGASAKHLQDFPAQFPGAVTIGLQHTYRCSPQIVAAANGLLAGGGRRRAADGRANGALQLRSRQPAGAAVVVRGLPDDIAEARAVAAGVRRWRDAGIALREIAVLVRINAATAPIEDALMEAGIAYCVTGGERFFARAEIKEAVVRLRGAARATTARRSAPEQPPGGRGPLTQEVAEVLAAMNFLEGDPPPGRGAVRERWESLAALSALAADLAGRDAGATLGDLVEDLDRRSAMDAQPQADGVSLATLHAAKGLEWDAVWIAGMQEGSLPISHADTVDRVEEERRLCYVGITRARRELVLSWAAARGGDPKSVRTPSRFLKDLSGAAPAGPEPSQESDPGGPGPGDGRTPGRPAQGRGRSGAVGRCRTCGKGLPTPVERALRRCRTCPEQLDEELLGRLTTWRAARASATGAPAYQIFTDLTLRALAELRPATLPELLTVTGVNEAKARRYGDAVLGLITPAAD